MKSVIPHFYTALLLIAMVSCGIFDKSENDPIIDEALLNIVWKVDTLKTPEETIIRVQDTLMLGIKDGDTVYVPQPGSDTMMTMQFNADMEFFGDIVCNYYLGLYEIPSKGTIVLHEPGRSEVGCGEKYLEISFLQAIIHVNAYALEGNRLMLYDDTDQYVIQFVNE